MEFRILGLLEVLEGEQIVEVRGGKLRRLLAALLLRVNEPVAAETLMEVLWGEEPPPSSVNSLQGYVSQLRKALGPEIIRTRPPGYLLATEPAAVDARRFEDLLAQGRAAARAEQPAAAARLLETALSLWRGHALADFIYDTFASAEATRLEELRVVATEELVDAQLAIGMHAELVGRLQSLVVAHPLRERLWGLLMLALYRCGRQAEALRAFTELRSRLGDELGIDASPGLHRLENDMLQQRPSLEWSPPERTRSGAVVEPESVAMPETRYARSGGMHIAYQVTGEGDFDIVVVPGWISHLESQWEEQSYRRFMQRLSSFARVIRFDKRNMGLSDRIGDSMPPLEDRMDDVRAVMDAAGSRRAAIIGVSEGSALSILFAATAPERVTSLVLVGGSARLAVGPDYEWGMTPDGAAALRHELDLRWGSGVTLPLINPSGADDPAVLDWWARFERIAASPGAAIATASMCLQIDVRDLLPQLRVPALVVHRRDDLLVEAGHGRYLAEHIPDAQYAELEGNDHWPWIGDADSVLREIEAFLTRPSRRAEPDTVLTTILFIEAVDASERRAVTLAQRRAVLERALADFRGREAATDGRGTVATFDGPARAIRCAVAVRDGVGHLGLATRAGLHVGEVQLHASEVHGLAVQVAAAIAASARPGEVVVSRTVRDIVAGAGIELHDRGALDPAAAPGEWHLFTVGTA